MNNIHVILERHSQEPEVTGVWVVNYTGTLVELEQAIAKNHVANPDNSTGDILEELGIEHKYVDKVITDCIYDGYSVTNVEIEEEEY